MKKKNKIVVTGPKLVKVLSVRSDAACVVDTNGETSLVIHIDTPVNVGDEIDIITETRKVIAGDGEFCYRRYDTSTKVLKNYTQEKMIADFVSKNKSKSR